MNDYQNTGNANAALTQLSFNQQNWLADKFIHCLFRLIGEDMPEALVGNYFNKEHAISLLDKMIEELPLPLDNMPPLAKMEPFFCLLSESIYAVKVEDNTAHSLVWQLQHENASHPHYVPSPARMVDDNDDEDMYTDNDNNSACNASPVQTAKRDEGLVDIEAEEVPPGEEIPDQSSEEETMKNKSSDSSDSSKTGSDDEDDKSSTNWLLLWVHTSFLGLF